MEHIDINEINNDHINLKKRKYYIKIAQIIAIFALPAITFFPTLLKFTVILSSIPIIIGLFFLILLGFQYILYKFRKKQKDVATPSNGGM